MLLGFSHVPPRRPHEGHCTAGGCWAGAGGGRCSQALVGFMLARRVERESGAPGAGEQRANAVRTGLKTGSPPPPPRGLPVTGRQVSPPLWTLLLPGLLPPPLVKATATSRLVRAPTPRRSAHACPSVLPTATQASRVDRGHGTARLCRKAPACPVSGWVQGASESPLRTAPPGAGSGTGSPGGGLPLGGPAVATLSAPRSRQAPGAEMWWGGTWHVRVGRPGGPRAAACVPKDRSSPCFARVPGPATRQGQRGAPASLPGPPGARGLHASSDHRTRLRVRPASLLGPRRGQHTGLGIGCPRVFP